MNRWITCLLVVALAAAVSACGGPESLPPAPEEAKAVQDKPAEPEEAAQTAPEKKPAEKAPEPQKPEKPATAQKPANESAANAITQVAKTQPPANASAGAQPKIMSPEPIHNFGNQRTDKDVEHNFVIRNVGEGTLVIRQVRTSCGCTVAQPEDKTLEPGAETRVKAKLKLRGRQGPQTKTITVESNDPENPVFKLQFKGTAIPPIKMEPQRILFGKVMDDESRSETVKITTTEEDLTFNIESVDASGIEGMEHELETIKEGKEYALEVRLPEGLPSGHHNGRFVIRTDNESHRVLLVRVNVQIVGFVEVMPPLVNLRYSDDPEKKATQYLRASKGRAEKFAITEVVPPIESMDVELQPRGDGEYLIKLIDMPLDDTLDGKELVVRTNLEEKPEIRVPFRVIKPRRTRGAVRPAVNRPAQVKTNQQKAGAQDASKPEKAE